MVAKLAFFFCFVVAAAGLAIPVAVSSAKLVNDEPDSPAHYQYEYSVHDSKSGDIKQQKESRSGNTVYGSYSLVQPDGTHRIVEYTADKEHGFNAVVRVQRYPAVSHIATVNKLAPAPTAKVVIQTTPVIKAAYATPPVPVTKALHTPAPVAYASDPVTYPPIPVAKPFALAPYNYTCGSVFFSSPAVTYHH